jgi:hypothetical protein
VRLASPIGSAAGGSVNLSTSLSNVTKLAAHPKFVWVFNANCDGTIIYNDPVSQDGRFDDEIKGRTVAVGKLTDKIKNKFLAKRKIPKRKKDWNSKESGHPNPYIWFSNVNTNTNI